MLAAVARRDPKAARAAMCAHLRQVRKDSALSDRRRQTADRS
ncbi:MAG: hypothetical protein AB1817_16440 [Chloroflexota bacterium]